MQTFAGIPNLPEMDVGALVLAWGQIARSRLDGDPERRPESCEIDAPRWIACITRVIPLSSAVELIHVRDEIAIVARISKPITVAVDQ